MTRGRAGSFDLPTGTSETLLSHKNLLKRTCETTGILALLRLLLMFKLGLVLLYEWWLGFLAEAGTTYFLGSRVYTVLAVFTRDAGQKELILFFVSHSAHGSKLCRALGCVSVSMIVAGSRLARLRRLVISFDYKAAAFV